nr:hypothetical protein BaRGS_013684 [Batillaria attramentaria]
MFFTGWWMVIDAAAIYPDNDQFNHAYHTPGAISTLAFFVLCRTGIVQYQWQIHSDNFLSWIAHVLVRNRYDALTRLNGEENLASDAEKKKSEVDKRQNKITENANHKQRPTPLERLMRMKIRSEATSLLIGDSVTQYVDEKRVSVGGAVVQNMSVQAGDGNSKDPPTPQIPCRL